MTTTLYFVCSKLQGHIYQAVPLYSNFLGMEHPLPTFPRSCQEEVHSIPTTLQMNILNQSLWQADQHFHYSLYILILGAEPSITELVSNTSANSAQLN